jgi:hypothetical protein
MIAGTLAGMLIAVAALGWVLAEDTDKSVPGPRTPEWKRVLWVALPAIMVIYIGLTYVLITGLEVH